MLRKLRMRVAKWTLGGTLAMAPFASIGACDQGMAQLIDLIGQVSQMTGEADLDPFPSTETPWPDDGGWDDGGWDDGGW